jgi:excisionase family DNA binding protein
MKNSHETQERPKLERRALSIVETSEATGLSRSSLYRAMESGALATVKVGGRRLVPVTAVDALLNVG